MSAFLSISLSVLLLMSCSSLVFLFCLFVFFFFFFFFQAEDGIRDWSVTGVQTCALPISGRTSPASKRRFSSRRDRWMSKVNAGILGTGHSYPKGILTNADLEKIVDTSDEWITTRTRSEERRVGKECRSRWSQEH